VTFKLQSYNSVAITILRHLFQLIYSLDDFIFSIIVWIYFFGLQSLSLFKSLKLENQKQESEHQSINFREYFVSKKYAKFPYSKS